MEKKEKRLLFCFAIYVALFIGLSLYPANTTNYYDRVKIIETLYRSNLLYPFIINSILFIYYALKK